MLAAANLLSFPHWVIVIQMGALAVVYVFPRDVALVVPHWS
jgi:hypothetical protein